MGARRVLFVGDSLTYGYDGSSGGLGSLPALAGLLAAAGTPAAVGLSVPPQGLGRLDARWAAPPMWHEQKVAGLGFGGDGASYWTSDLLEGPLTYSPGTSCDTFDFYWTGSANARALVSVDGGAASTISSPSPTAVMKSSFGADGPSASHALSVKLGGGRLEVLGVEAYLRGDSTLLLGNAGVDGSQATWWVRENLPGLGPLDCVASYGADVVVVSLGGDDLAGGVPMATWLADLQELVASAQRGGAATVLVSTMEPVNPALGFDAAMEVWNAAIAGWAEGAGVRLVDLWTDFEAAGGYAALSARGYYYADGVHLSDAGYAWRAQLLEAPILAVVG